MLILLLAIVLLITALALILTGFRIVPARQALVIYNSQTGWVEQVAIGPRLVFKLPLLEETITLDLSFQQTRLRMSDLTTADCLAIEASMDVDFDLYPDFLRTTDINRIMPLLPKVATVVENLARYLLQGMAAQFTAADLLTHPQMRVRLERDIHRTLSDSVRWLGVRVMAVRLLLRPAAAMLEAELAAQAQARTLLALINTTGADRELLAQILPLQLLGAQPGNARLLASLNLQTAAGGTGAAPAIHWVVDETR